jgi:hypothetical protein
MTPQYASMVPTLVHEPFTGVAGLTRRKSTAL